MHKLNLAMKVQRIAQLARDSSVLLYDVSGLNQGLRPDLELLLSRLTSPRPSHRS